MATRRLVNLDKVPTSWSKTISSFFDRQVVEVKANTREQPHGTPAPHGFDDFARANVLI
jgi:hypothetical protein